MADGAVNINMKVEDALSVSLEQIRAAQELAWDQGARTAAVYNFDFADLEDDVLIQNPYRKADDTP